MLGALPIPALQPEQSASKVGQALVAEFEQLFGILRVRHESVFRGDTWEG